MKKMLFAFALGVMSVSLALAQDPAPQDPTPNTPTAAPTDTSNNASSIQGCLSAANGAYTLTQDGTNTMFTLVGMENQLKKHVGHEIAVSGEITGGTGSAGSVSAQGQTQPSATAAVGNAIQVTNVKMISKQCGATADSNQAH